METVFLSQKRRTTLNVSLLQESIWAGLEPLAIDGGLILSDNSRVLDPVSMSVASGDSVSRPIEV